MSATEERDEFTGMEKVVLRNRSGETVEVYRHGAHIVSWKSAQQQEFQPDPEQLKLFPYPFKLQTKISLGTNVLTQELAAFNTVTGLKDLKYMDNLEARAEKVDEGAKITFNQEVDRIYLNAPNTITITDTSSMTRFVIHKSGFPDAVVWNPWVDKAKAMADFGDEEYKVMVCIEPAVAGSGPFRLGAGRSWVGQQSITCEALTQDEAGVVVQPAEPVNCGRPGSWMSC